MTLRRPLSRGSSLNGEERRRICRRRQLAVVLVLALVGLALLMGTALGAAHLTSGSGVCRQCHEMQPYYTGWQQSVHKSLECAQCHIPSGTVGLVKAKIGALREIYVHFAGVVHMPLEVESTAPRATCRSCHPKPADASYATSAFNHTAHASGDCVDCHRGLFHPASAPAKPDPTGAKLGTMADCLTCHDGRSARKTCATCHQASHAAFGECGLCHTEKNWNPFSAAEAAKRGFDHPLALNGRHATLKCADCHKTIGTGKAAAALPTKCGGCHGDRHRGLTDCTRCHTTGGWTPANFSHPGVSGINWRGMACSDCHPNGYAGYACTKCHDSNNPDD